MPPARVAGPGQVERATGPRGAGSAGGVRPGGTRPRPTSRSSASSTSGGPYDLATKQSAPRRLLYDSKDLVTHAVCVGMTGSGKTGLCLGADRGGAARRHPRAHHRSEGRPPEPLPDLPGSPSGGLRPVGQRGRRPAQGVSPSSVRRDSRPSSGGRGWRRGDRTARGSGACATRPTSSCTRPAARRGCRCRSSSRSRAPAGRRARRRGALPRADRDHRDEPPRAPRRSRPTRSGAGSTSCSRRLFETAWRDGRDLDLPALIQQIQNPPVDQGGRARSRRVLPREGPLRAGDAGSTTSWPPRASTPGSRASRSTSARSSTRPRASRAPRSSRSPTCRTPSGCSSSRSC